MKSIFAAYSIASEEVSKTIKEDDTLFYFIDTYLNNDVIYIFERKDGRRGQHWRYMNYRGGWTD